MLFAVRFIDKPNQHGTRKQSLQAHLDWLDQHQECVLIGGSLRLEPDQQAVGGLWIVEASSKAEIASLIQTDPFWIQGLRQSYEIFHWSKAFADRKIAI